MFDYWRRLVKLCFILFAAGLWNLTAASAQDSLRLDVTGVDTSQFPLVSVNLIAADGESRAVASLSGLSLSENGRPVDSYDVEQLAVGVEVIFVIDANASIRVRDTGSTQTRLEKVRDSIVRFSDQFMNQAQLDRVSLLVPDGESGRFALQDAIFRNEVINEINFYDPGTPRATPLQSMMEMAIAKAAENSPEGRFQAIVLYSDAGALDDQLDFEALALQAQAIHLPIFAAILGLRADADEIASVQALATPTGGFYVHMPEPPDADPIYDVLRSQQSQSQLRYRSTLAESGSHSLLVTLGAASADATFELEVSPPAVELLLDNSQPVRRVADDPDADLDDMEPTSQPIVAQVSWPDGYPRTIAAVRLLVNGEEVALPTGQAPVVDGNGVLTFDWDISKVGEGVYDLQVAVTDELGLESASAPLPLTLEIVLPEVVEPAPTAETSSPTAETPVTEGPADISGGISRNLGIIGIAGGVAAVGFAFFIVVVAFVLLRRRRSAAPAAVTPAAPGPAYSGATAAAMEHDATQIILPNFITHSTAAAHLEPLENVPGHTGPIPISGSNVAIGRDPRLAQIVFGDKSVSRLHARIMESGGAFRLYDEGSASGTYLNFERIGLTPQPLKDNDAIHIGRVHLRFRLAAVAAAPPPMPAGADSTQIMGGPQRAATPGPAAVPAPPSAADEGLGTQPYMPNQPQAPGRVQPPGPSQDNPPDDISTQPFMPHSPKR